MLKFLALIVLSCAFGALTIPEAFENTKIVKTVDMADSVFEVNVKYTVKSLLEGVSKYYVSIPRAVHDRMALIACSTSKISDLPIALADSDSNFMYYLVRFPTVIESNLVITVKYYLTGVTVPLPETIFHMDVQRLTYTETVLAPSPYPTKSQTVKYIIEGGSLISFTPAYETTDETTSVEYGPIVDVAPNTLGQSVTLHYVDNGVKLTYDFIEREIEVSHWGNVAFEEYVRVRNSGTPITGEFSRLDYMVTNQRSRPTFDTLTATVDSAAKDIYYRDIIGNITTSAVKKTKSGTEIEFNTRFPMIGGWKIEFHWGYNLPSARVLSRSSTRYSMTVPFSSPLHDGHIEELSVRVILPEKATNIEFTVPSGVSDPVMDKRFTYLDTFDAGRPVLEFHQRNVIPKQSTGTITVTYSMNRLVVMREPILCVLFFFALFALKAIVQLASSRMNEGESDLKKKVD